MRITGEGNGKTFFKQNKNNKSVFSNIGTLKAWHCPHFLLRAMLRHRSYRKQSISPTRRAHSSKPAARWCRGRMGQTDGQNDGSDWRTPYLFLDSAPHTMRSLRKTDMVRNGSDKSLWSQFRGKRESKVGRICEKYPIFKYRAFIQTAVPYRKTRNGTSSHPDCFSMKLAAREPMKHRPHASRLSRSVMREHSAYNNH